MIEAVCRDPVRGDLRVMSPRNWLMLLPYSSEEGVFSSSTAIPK
jgi:hypothetical protein